MNRCSRRRNCASGRCRESHGENVLHEQLPRSAGCQPAVSPPGSRLGFAIIAAVRISTRASAFTPCGLPIRPPSAVLLRRTGDTADCQSALRFSRPIRNFGFLDSLSRTAFPDRVDLASSSDRHHWLRDRPVLQSGHSRPGTDCASTSSHQPHSQGSIDRPGAA